MSAGGSPPTWPPRPLAVAYVIADYFGGVPEDYTVLVQRILSVVEGEAGSHEPPGSVDPSAGEAQR